MLFLDYLFQLTDDKKLEVEIFFKKTSIEMNRVSKNLIKGCINGKSTI